MADPFLAEIRAFPYGVVPAGWAACNGQLLPIAQNTALYSILGTTYGGNGTTTFALPDLRGAVPIHPSQGPGLSPRSLGESGGAESVTLTAGAMPAHSHALLAAIDPGDNSVPSSTVSLAPSTGGFIYAVAANLVPMSPQALASEGGSQPHGNLMPYLTASFNIAIQGTYPSRP
ncbi:MAG TPA: tail fiber protein [Longimicrobium sp.]|jgi:microcystin-dependent protein